MVSAVRHGRSMRAVARQLNVGLATVQLWVRRAGKQRLDRVEFADRPAGPRRVPHRVDPEIEHLIVQVRRELKHDSDLGEYGAQAIHHALLERQYDCIPCVRTIGRVLERHGILDGRRRTRRPAPPRGWYLPDVAAGEVELDSFDAIEGLVIKSGPQVEVLTCTALQSGRVGAWPMQTVTAKAVVQALLEHWRDFGLPAYAQFDNDTRFQGPHHFVDVFGRVIRLCLNLDVVPVFVPPRETGFQAAIENFNGRWQAKVWARFHHDCLAELQERSHRYLQASHQRAAARIEAACDRRIFPKGYRLKLQAPLRGRVIFLRRTTEHGSAHLLGRTFEVERLWPHRLVRCEVDLDKGWIHFYALRRRDPNHQPLLNKIRYKVPTRTFHE